MDTAIPCGLIINELASNSLKHAFSAGKGGEIRIDLHSDKDNQFTLIVSDNGVGFPEGLDFRDTKSLGLQLVNTLVDQLGGTIELHSSGGTEFNLAFSSTRSH
jgi:two-component sensor histidine kinase